MGKALILVVACVLGSSAFAQSVETKPTQIKSVRERSPTIVSSKGEFILRQDLFDPNSPNNLRADWPRPNGLPGPNH
jgi:hypothetical protein